MKHHVLGIVMGLMMVLGSVGTAIAAEATAAADLVSAYVWRGITFNDGMVFQPSLDVTGDHGIGFNVWGNLDIDDYDDALDDGEFSEIDLTLSYGFSIEPVDVTAGYIEYLFPNGGEGTREVFLSLYTELAEGLSVGIDGYYDVDEVEDFYISVFLGYSAEFSNGFGVGFGALAGYVGDDWSDFYTGAEDGGLHEYTFTAEASYSFTDTLGVTAFLAYTDSFDDDVLPDGEFGQDVNFYGGASLAYSF